MGKFESTNGLGKYNKNTSSYKTSSYKENITYKNNFDYKNCEVGNNINDAELTVGEIIFTVLEEIPIIGILFLPIEWLFILAKTIFKAIFK